MLVTLISWRWLLLTGILGLAASVVAEGIRHKDRALEDYNRAFYSTHLGIGYFFADSKGTLPSRLLFWQTCEEIEMVEDAYQANPKPSTKKQISELINGLNSVISGSPDWASWNKFNDDLMWGCIALLRAYRMTGTHLYLDQAKDQFDKVWARGHDDKLGGGIYWTTDKNEKNSCIVCPAAIASVLMYRSTKDKTYLDRAIGLMDWEIAHLFENKSGRVADHQNLDAKVDWGAYTYNQGTFMGAASLLFDETRNADYLAQAKLAADWARTNLTGKHSQEILNDEYSSDAGGGDGVGFKGVFSRWACIWASQHGDADYRQWLVRNAQAATTSQNSKGLMWSHWGQPTPDHDLYAWECCSAVAMVLNSSKLSIKSDRK